MTSASYNAAISGDVAAFKSTTSSRWTSLDYWTTPQLQTVFNAARANELTGNSKIAAAIGTLIRK